MSPSPVVLIIGCGIAGPVLAILLKRKGYDPIVFDKVSRIGDAGASLMLMPNGLKVLSLVDLSEPMLEAARPLDAIRDLTAQGTTLGRTDAPSMFKGKYMQPARGIKRTTISMMLKTKLHELGIEVREGWNFVRFEEDETSVAAFFDNERCVKGSFLVGCDGIKSMTRKSVLAQHGKTETSPIYTGLMQTAGMSPAPASWLESSELRNFYGDGLHAITYPLSQNTVIWAVTQRNGIELQETWRTYEAEEAVEKKKQLSDLLSGWDETFLRVVDGAERIVSFGLFDRDELQPEHWYSKRCILVGDAAHPSTPHAGQGANQALEDCYHLYRSLPMIQTGDQTDGQPITALGPDLSTTIFMPFADKRQPRTAALVKAARMQGDRRVVTGEEACRKRDADITMGYHDMTAAAERLDSILREPFNRT